MALRVLLTFVDCWEKLETFVDSPYAEESETFEQSIRMVPGPRVSRILGRHLVRDLSSSDIESGLNRGLKQPSGGSQQPQKVLKRFSDGSRTRPGSLAPLTPIDP
jgi:hypothetical protein